MRSQLTKQHGGVSFLCKWLSFFFFVLAVTAAHTKFFKSSFQLGEAPEREKNSFLANAACFVNF